MAKRSRTKKQPAPRVVSVEPMKILEEATGTDQLPLQQHLINQVCNTLWIPEGLSEDEKSARITSAMLLLQGIRPADEIESMLAVQMVGTHSAAMECLRLAMIGGQTFAGRDQSLKHASKLLSIYSRQIEVLDKRRGKGQQKVTVEYVHVAVRRWSGTSKPERQPGLENREPNPRPKRSPTTPARSSIWTLRANSRRRAENPEALEWPGSVYTKPIRCFPARDAAQEPEAGNPVVRRPWAARNAVACMAARRDRARR